MAFVSYIAHVKNNTDEYPTVHLLQDHLDCTAAKAGEFAALFGNRDWGEILGFWHDLGKFHPSWQKYIRSATGFIDDATFEDAGGRVNHSTAGAVLCYERISHEQVARILAYCIAGHHAGLPDCYHDESGGDLNTRLFNLNGLRIEELSPIRQIADAQEFIGKDLPKSSPSCFNKPGGLEYLHLWIRMLYSCLVDADYLDTENFMTPEKSRVRNGYLSLPQLQARFTRFMEIKQGSAADTPINKKRRDIYSACLEKAKTGPGFFSLNVPTGGGKTLSSMAFALEHARLHGKKRIIMAIPYTSIIEQTAKVLQFGSDDDEEIQRLMAQNIFLFGDEQVLEHHSNLDPEQESDRNKLASENWDAPIIVTTNVQLFESLFASRSSSCRKLHNLADSVIILDEAQMLPPEFLGPILSVLRGLVLHFDATVVLMTATQPALEGRIGAAPHEFKGIENVTHIIDDPTALSRDFERVTIGMPERQQPVSAWSDISETLVQYEQVLCIVNSRKDCRRLHSLMPEGTIHLSALMCGEDRTEVISRIKEQLKRGGPVRVISTQLVEAGVDIDFPVVYRALAGLDSIAQAAGRCNREGKLNAEGKRGKVVVFSPPHPSPAGLLRKGEDAAKWLLRNSFPVDLTPEMFSKYFTFFYGSVNTIDKPDFVNRMITDAGEGAFQFRTLSHNFHLIDDAAQKSIIVQYRNTRTGKDSSELIEALRRAGMSRSLGRKLQRFVVTVDVKTFEKFQEIHYITNINECWVQTDPGLYKPGLGLLIDEQDWLCGSTVV